MMAGTSFLDALKAAAAEAEAAEASFRQQTADRIKVLEQERAFAYRRLNLMSALADVVAPAESEDAAVAGGLAALRAKLGWEGETETRTEVLSRFALVVRTAFASLAPTEADVIRALADFEAWYAATRQQPFWNLFEQYIPEMPLVER
jgi:hypothetical protein